MAKQDKPAEVVKEVEDELTAILRGCTSVSELYRVTQDPDFIDEVAQLPDATRERLRRVYVERQAILDNKVKLEEFDGKTAMLVGVEGWTSDYGTGVTLHLIPENSERIYKALSSSAAIVRFAQRLNPLPTEQHPYRVSLALVPVSNPDNAAKGHKRWTIKMLPLSDTARSSGAPF